MTVKNRQNNKLILATRKLWSPLIHAWLNILDKLQEMLRQRSLCAHNLKRSSKNVLRNETQEMQVY